MQRNSSKILENRNNSLLLDIQGEISPRPRSIEMGTEFRGLASKLIRHVMHTRLLAPIDLTRGHINILFNIVLPHIYYL
jgi:hypothetical protein